MQGVILYGNVLNDRSGDFLTRILSVRERNYIKILEVPLANTKFHKVTYSMVSTYGKLFKKQMILSKLSQEALSNENFALLLNQMLKALLI